MKRSISASVILLFCFLISSCGSTSTGLGPIAGQAYVIAPSDKAKYFTKDLASLVEKHGMIANLGQATDDNGQSVYVLDATSAMVRLRSENILLSGHEDANLCGVYAEPHSDPGQYFISVSPSDQRADPLKSRKLLAKIVKDLKIDGYDVRSKPVLCSAQSKAESDG